MAIKLTVMPLDMDPSSKPIIKIFNKEELTLGRLPSNDVVLNRPEVSGIHARVRIEHDEFGEVSKLYITDLGSSNGTLVEKNPLKARVEVQMMPNERIFIGSYVIKPTTQVEEGKHDSRTTIEVPQKNINDDSAFASKTQAFDNVKFEAVSVAVKDGEVEAEEEREEEKIAVNSSLQSPKNAFSSIMFGSEPSGAEIPEKETSVLRSMYSAPIGDSHFREPEQRLSPFGKPYVEEQDEEEVVPSEQATVEARPTWAQVKEDFLEEKEEAEQQEPTYSRRQATVEISSLSSPIRGELVLETAKSDVPVKHVERFSIRVTAGDESEQGLKVQAKAFTSIKGKVSHRGKPLAGVSVKSSAFGHTTTDASGYYEFSRVLEDTHYSLSFAKEHFIIEPNTFEGSASVGASEILIQATRLCSIKGIISHNGRPLEGVEVSAGELGKKVTNADGVYQFDNVPEGREYDLVLSKEGYAFQS